MRRWLPFCFYLGLAGVAAAAGLAGSGAKPGARAATVATGGDFAVANDHDGAPIFTASGVAPGDAASGTVAIADSGDLPAELTIHRHELVDAPGLGGGLLSGELTLRIADVSEAAPRTLYSGPLSAMPEVAAGRLEAGETRRFEFTATLPEAGPAVDQNDVQGASTSVAFAWDATEAEESGEEGGEEEQGGGEGGGDTPGGGGGPSGGGGAPGDGGIPGRPGSDGAEPGLDLAVTKVSRGLRAGRVLAWTDCDLVCTVRARGRVHARAADGARRSARLRLIGRPPMSSDAIRLRFRLPPHFRHWLRKAARPVRLRARIRFVAVDAFGQRDVERRTLRLRPPRR